MLSRVPHVSTLGKTGRFSYSRRMVRPCVPSLTQCDQNHSLHEELANPNHCPTQSLQWCHCSIAARSTVYQPLARVRLAQSSRLRSRWAYIKRSQSSQIEPIRLSQWPIRRVKTGELAPSRKPSTAATGPYTFSRCRWLCTNASGAVRTPSNSDLRVSSELGKARAADRVVHCGDGRVTVTRKSRASQLPHTQTGPIRRAHQTAMHGPVGAWERA